MKRAKNVDEYIASQPQWSEALTKLRKVIQSTELEETIKWGAPCYTLDGKLVVGLAGFSKYFGLWFHQGVYMKDPDKVLINAQEGTTKALRQWRFERIQDIKVRKVKAYVLEAIENQRQGKAMKPDRSKPLVLPPELKAALAKSPKARQAFEGLTKGRRREYADHVTSAKRAETKQSRIEKMMPLIKAGVGLHDKYRNC